MTVLFCIYTCQQDQTALECFESTPLLQHIKQTYPSGYVYVFADPSLQESELTGARLIVSSPEGYDALSLKSFAMIKACLSIEFDFLVKIDCTLATYHAVAHNKTHALLEQLSPARALASLLDPDFFRQPYNGLVSIQASEEGFCNWARIKGLTTSYRSVFKDGEKTPSYFLGKLYSLRRDFCVYIAQNGSFMAEQHYKFLGGAEDMMIGRLYDDWQKQQRSSSPER